MGGLLFRRASGAVLKLDPAVHKRLLEFRQVALHQEEAGGVLLGRHIVGCHDIVVDEVTCPTAGDIQSRAFFYRSQEHHQQIIDTRWRDSDGTCHYLGEWHTHPECEPTPSPVDMADWRRRLRTDIFYGESLFFIIVGTSEVRAWEGTRQSLEVHLYPLARFQPSL
jgi:integrative and conjugative element protein (TIGR02256 family)